jgi:hypothetical protein
MSAQCPVGPTLRTQVGHLPRSEKCQSGCEQSQQTARAMYGYSITSSARASSVGGTSRPRAWALLRLIISSNLVGCTTGRSAGFSPLRMRPVVDAGLTVPFGKATAVARQPASHGGEHAPARVVDRDPLDVQPRQLREHGACGFGDGQHAATIRRQSPERSTRPSRFRRWRRACGAARRRALSRSA